MLLASVCVCACVWEACCVCAYRMCERSNASLKREKFTRALVSGCSVPSAQPGTNKQTKTKSCCRKRLISPTNTFHTTPHYNEDDDCCLATAEPCQNKKTQNQSFAPKIPVLYVKPSQPYWTSNYVWRVKFLGGTTWTD